MLSAGNGVANITVTYIIQINLKVVKIILKVIQIPILKIPIYWLTSLLSKLG